jgi:uncharacterized membrane protein (DUF485 family)
MNHSIALTLPLTDAAVEADLPAQLRRIHHSAAYIQLRKRRNRLSLILSAAMLAIYYGFILLVAFAPQTLGERTGVSQITLGIPLGLGVIISAIVLTGIYVLRANKEFDELTRNAIRSAQS